MKSVEDITLNDVQGVYSGWRVGLSRRPCRIASALQLWLPDRRPS